MIRRLLQRLRARSRPRPLLIRSHRDGEVVVVSGGSGELFRCTRGYARDVAADLQRAAA